MAESEQEQIWRSAIGRCSDLPQGVRNSVDSGEGIDASTFDESYIEFLDTQIRLSPRGPEWTERLKARRAALKPWCGRELIRGRIRAGGNEYWVSVSSETSEVVHWEWYGEMA